MTIQLKLTLWYTALLGATLIIFSGLIYYALSTSLNAQLREDAVVQAAEVSRYLIQQLDAPKLFSSVADAEPNRFQRGSFRLIQIPQPRVLAGSGDVQIFSRETGEIFLRTQNFVSHPIPIEDETQAVVLQGEPFFSRAMQDEIPLLIYSFPVVTNREVLGVQVLQSMQPIERMLRDVWRYLLLGTILALVLAALVGAYLAQRALQPLKTITHTAGSISQTGDLGRRLAISETTSEVGQLATTFNQMLEQIQRLFSAQERLVADVGHELRTPLTSIQGNIELLQRVMKSSSQSDALQSTLQNSSSAQPSAKSVLVQETMQETLVEVDGEVQRMSMIISDLLLVAQAESGNLVLRKEVVEMDTLLLEVYRQTRQIATWERQDGELEVRLGSEDQALVYGDRQRLRQLLLNLAENAVKYTPHSGTVTLSLTNVDGWVRISVQDTGIGISDENQRQIFERFYRTDKARNREMGGSGLGLSIVQWIAQAHDGHVTVESKPHVGSTFTLWLPELIEE